MGNQLNILRATACAVAAAVGSYFLFLTVLTIPALQNQAIYLNSVKLTWFKDVNYPEQWGFLHNQVTPFNLRTSDGETLHAWHILPPGLYYDHVDELLEQPSGLIPDIRSRRGFQLLRDDPEALLVLYFHGAAGTLGSGFRPPSYRAISALAPGRIHIVAIDYRGFGTSTGTPSEEGLLRDAITLAEWAMDVAGIPPSRIVIFGQSLGTGVSTALTHYYASKPVPTLFSGMVFVAPFVDVALLTATYRVAGTIPLLGPVARFPKLLAFFNTLIRDKWPSKDRLANFVRIHEAAPSAVDTDLTTSSNTRSLPKYWVHIIHAEDDYDITWKHSEELFWHAVNATVPKGISYEDLEREKDESRKDRGEGGWMVERRTDKGVIIEDILKHGLHDMTMGYPAVSVAILRAFQHS